MESYCYSKHFKNNQELLSVLKTQLNKGDAIYLKASRSMHFETIIGKL